MRHFEERGEREKCGIRMEWEGCGFWGRGVLQSEQNATNEQTGWTKMKMTETLDCIKVRRTKMKLENLEDK